MAWVDALGALLRPFLEGPGSHALRLWRDRAYREHMRLQVKLAGMPRYRGARVALEEFDVELVDAASFLAAHYEIFAEQIYRFPCEERSPCILDLGANIGLATLWFKQHYPGARIIAVEPDPAIYACLEGNVRRNGLTDVELVNKAAWIADTTLRFARDGADGGRAFAAGEAPELPGRPTLEVEALAIDRLIAGRHIDFIKMDIEGAENAVLPACKGVLGNVRWLFVEYHALRDRPSELSTIVRAIESAGFRLYIENAGPRRRPVMGEQPRGDFDMQLNLFGWR